MQGTAQIQDALLALFPTADDGLLDLFASAWENANLMFTDFCTINDLLECGGYQQSLPLHVLLLDLFLALEEGSLCIRATEDDLVRRLHDLVDETRARTWARAILAECRPERFPDLIGRGVDEGRPVVLHENGCYYFQRYLRAEMIFASQLQARLELTTALPSPLALSSGGRGGEGADLPRIRQVLHEVLVAQPLSAGGKLLHLGARQRLAVALSLLRNFLAISGGPGTGKTSIVVSVLRALVRGGCPPERIALAAPTGRAAQRLTDAIHTGLGSLPENCALEERQLVNLEAHTLHHLLRYSPTRGTFLCHAENPIQADVVIVDEVSMVGLGMMAQLLQATRPDARLILLGDKDQLPSVEAGAVLANLLPENVEPNFSAELRAQLQQVLPDGLPPALRDGSTGQPTSDAFILLDENYRSQPHIRAVAKAVNEQRGDIVEELPVLSEGLAAAETCGGCWWLPQPEGSLRQYQAVLRDWAERQMLHGGPSYQELVARAEAAELDEANRGLFDQLFQALNRSRLLTIVREGPYGCVDINRLCGAVLRPHLDRGSRGEYFAGAPLLITRNDHSRRLYNGDIGVTLKSPRGGYRGVFARQAGYVSFAAEALPQHEPGFALTVHKSQGSEYERVMLVLPPTGGRRLLTKEIVYTGLTRAKQLAIICSTKEILRAAIGRRIERTSQTVFSLGASWTVTQPTPS